MSSTAGVTVPSQRQVYATKVQISSKDKSHKSKSRPNKLSNNRGAKIAKSAKTSKSNDSGEELHRSWGKSRNYAYVFTGTADEKPWTKSEVVPPSKPKSYKARGKPKAHPAEEEHHVYKIKEDGKRKVKKGTLVVSDKYFEAVKDERSRLLDLLNSLQKRNDVLERENADMVSNFEALHRENEQLRKKLDTGGEPVVESYKRVYDDRTLLREAESSYKNRLMKLEEELRQAQRNHARVEDELRMLKVKNGRMSEEASNKVKYNKYYWDCYHLRAENDFLKVSVKSLKDKIEELTLKSPKGPQTAPTAVVKPPESIVPYRPSESYGQHVKYVTLPEIDERRQKGRKYGVHV